MSADKENTPIIDTQTMLTLNDLNITNSTGPEGLPQTSTNLLVLAALSAYSNALGAFTLLNQSGKTT